MRAVLTQESPVYSLSEVESVLVEGIKEKVQVYCLEVSCIILPFTVSFHISV